MNSLTIAVNNLSPQDPFFPIKRALLSFLPVFSYELITLEVQSDKENRSVVNTKHFKSRSVLKKIYDEKGIPFSDSDNPRSIESTPNAKKLAAKTSHAFTLEELLSDPVLRELVAIQKSSRAVWFMVNEGDGVQGNPPNENCRSQKNVTKLKACFLDTDNCPIETVNAFLNKYSLTEHFRIQSSKNKFHLYFLIEDEAPSIDTLPKWRAVQHALARLGDPEAVPSDLGTDASMHDYSKVLRLPGFLHQKTDEQRVSGVVNNSNLPKYRLDTLYSILGGERFHAFSPQDNYSLDTGFNGNGHHYSEPEGPVKKSSRHAALMQFLGSVKHNCLTKEDLLRQAYGFIIQHEFEDSRAFLPGGERYHSDTIREVDYAWAAKREAEKSILDGVPLYAPKIDRSLQEQLHVEREAFTRLPGLAGEMIKEAIESCPYMIPSMAFACVCALIGTVKSRFVKCDGFRSCNYFLCTAPTGTGKSFPKDMIIDLLRRTHQLNIYRANIRSGQGMLPFLQSNHGYGLLIIDEAMSCLKAMQSDRAQSYEQAILSYLLQFYSSTDTPFVESETRTDPKSRITMPFVRLNSVMFGTEQTLEQAFTEDSIRSGFLPRQLVFHWNAKPQFIEDTIKPVFSQGIVEKFRGLLTQAGVAEETKLLELDEKLKELRDEKTTTNRYKELSKEIDELKRGHESADIKIKFGPHAKENLTMFGNKMAKRQGREMDKGNGLNPLFSRAWEQVMRLIPIFVDDEIADVSLVNALISIVETQKEAFYSVFGTIGGISDHAAAMEKVFTKARECCSESLENYVPLRQLCLAVRVPKHLKTADIVRDLVNADRLQVVQTGQQKRVYVKC